MRKIRVVIAGQVPPPYGGQNIMIEKAVTQFTAHPNCEAIHLPFYFTADLQTARRASFGKLLELMRVIARVVTIRMRGPIDILLYPPGGPQTVPLFRDLLLLPWILFLSRRVVLHFHAAGIADRFLTNPRSLLARLPARIYSQASGAIVMTEFNRRDPISAGIKRISVVPHRIPDRFNPSMIVQRGKTAEKRLLYLGHLCPDKGTDALLRAFAAFRKRHGDVVLELAGECLPPWSASDLDELIKTLDLRDYVRQVGVVSGKLKAEAFARADLFIFPSVAPYESFGLVLVEAMMWSLPIVASEWRGNIDVLTADAGAITFPVRDLLADRIEASIAQAFEPTSDWDSWGKRNRSIFERRYREEAGDLWLADKVLAEFR